MYYLLQAHNHMIINMYSVCQFIRWTHWIVGALGACDSVTGLLWLIGLPYQIALSYLPRSQSEE